MSLIQLDLNKTVRNMKPMHGGGQPPVISNGRDTYFHYLKEAGIPYSRLHDVNGAFGGYKYVDVPNIFRDFNADVNDPASYDFTFTDVLLEGLAKANVEPYYRLGVTIENAYQIKAYWVYAPADFQKWAEICEHIIAHYTKGWANGYHYKITYWEIWGEPDGCIWLDSNEEYFELYHVAATHLKKCFPEIKIGGYGATSFLYGMTENEPVRRGNPKYIDFLYGFLDYIKERNTPIDFLSWHSYDNTETVIKLDNWLHKTLVERGFGHIETHLNEWDPYCQELGTGHHGAELAAMMIAMQNGHPDVCCIYDMRIANAPYCPFFNPIKFKPVQGYYSFVSFNTLFQLGNQVQVSCDTDKLYVLAASNGKKHAMMISNLTGKQHDLDIVGADLSEARFHVIDDDRLLSWAPNADVIENNAVVLIEW